MGGKVCGARAAAMLAHTVSLGVGMLRGLLERAILLFAIVDLTSVNGTAFRQVRVACETHTGVRSTVIVWAPPTSAAIWLGFWTVGLSYPRHKDSTHRAVEQLLDLAGCRTSQQLDIRFRHFAVLPTISTPHLPFHRHLPLLPTRHDLVFGTRLRNPYIERCEFVCGVVFLS
eukprot:scaffold5781_cov124-Isochrysis_galbana.AAC.8